MAIPVIDERVKYVGPTWLRTLNGPALLEIAGPVVLQVNEEPVVVMIPYDQYLKMQEVWNKHGKKS